MGTDEMKEIADIIKAVLDAVKPAVILEGENKGKLSRANTVIDEKTKENSRTRVKALLDRFVLYPELDLNFLMEQFLI
jgi:glycine hydroxymethyltransferase